MNSEDKEIGLHLKDSDQRMFEGWYFKVTDDKISLAIIVGVSKTVEKSCAFIQTLDTYTNQSQMIEYDLDDFKWGNDPFYLQIKDNLFTKSKIVLNIEGDCVDLKGTLDIGQFTKLSATRYAPTIMGPFSYLPWNECNHGIISLKHLVQGSLLINDQTIKIDGIGYIEKDWGKSFPSEYLWLQSNNCKEYDASIFLSVANVPVLCGSFQGMIMTLLVDEKQYHIASYYGAYLKDYFTKEGYHYLVIKQRSYTFYFKIKPSLALELKAPQFGKMNGYVEESLKAITTLLVYKKDKQIGKFSFINCGLEIFGDIFDK